MTQPKSPGSLIQRTTSQEESVSSLLHNYLSPIHDSEDAPSSWEAFHNSYWGKGLDFLQEKMLVERGENPVEDPTLPDLFPPTCSVLSPHPILAAAWALSSRKVLVRSEYYEAEEAALSANEEGKDVFIVTGQPGIGKSPFLLWLLVCRLARKLPTALQINKGYAIFFRESGVYQFTNLDNPIPHDILALPSSKHAERIWALVDIGWRFPEPAGIFKRSEAFFIVDATSPSPKRPRWLDEVTHKEFCMKPWSLLEVLQARTIIGDLPQVYSEQEVYHLYNKFRASARCIAFYASDPECYEDHVNEEIAEMDPETIRHMFSRPYDTPRYVGIIEPSQTRRDVFETRVASKHILELLWKAYSLHRWPTSDVTHFCRLFQSSSDTTARWTFGIQAHEFLRRQQTVHLIPLVRDKPKVANFIYNRHTGEKLVALQLAKSEEYRFGKGDELCANRYYKPDPADFPAIDSFLLIPRSRLASPILVVFHIAWGAGEHRYHVVVSPEKWFPNTLIFWGEEGGTKPSKRSQVFNYPITFNRDSRDGHADPGAE